ncbi:MAG TPA: DUF1573 domain-containing protein [Bacteroidia bacterium]|nr:DUF1573 domain-containing protein [Bacteroidia bacterium]
MKTLFSTQHLVVFVLAAGLVACAPRQEKDVNTDMVNITATASGNAPTGKAPFMKLEKEKHDFGKISQGERVSTEFKFKNTGGSDLVISDAHGSCGCTVPDYPRKPIPPGGEDVIKVEFNSEGKSGKQEKTVTLTTNCEPPNIVITIASEVIVPADRGGDGHSKDDGHGH